MRKPVTNIGASIQARLRNLAKEKEQPFELLLIRYTLERLLYRLSTSAYWDRFVLKGAVLLTTWFDDPHRPTRDVDFLGFGDADPETILNAFREICAMKADDGVEFSVGDLAVDRTREELEYGVLRLKTNALVGAARVRVVIDIGFGDATEPGLEEMDLPVLLDAPAPHLRAYARETVIAEKFQAMVALGRANSRMKDIYDIWLLSKAYSFEGDGLARAIAATFARRKTAIPTTLPDALTPAFTEDPAKAAQWAAFVKDVAAEPGPLAGVVADLAAFLMPRAVEARAKLAKKSE